VSAEQGSEGVSSTDESETGNDRKREIIVTHHFETEIEVNRLDEWIDANFPTGGVQVMDAQTSEVLHDSL